MSGPAVQVESTECIAMNQKCFTAIENALKTSASFLNHSLFFFFQRALPLLQDCSVGMEELRAPQPQPQQVLREDREAGRQRHQPKKGLPLGHEPRQSQQNGRGGPQVVKKRPASHQEGHGIPS